MRLSVRTVLAATALALATLACHDSSGGIAGPTTTNVDVARQRWQSAGLENYRYEVRAITAWFPPGGFVRTEVREGRVVSAIDLATGESRMPFFTITDVWRQIDWYITRGEPVTGARFDSRGVPIHIMLGEFANDGGISYEIRKFVRLPDTVAF